MRTQHHNPSSQLEPSGSYVICGYSKQEVWTIAAVVWAFSVLMALTIGALMGAHHG